MSPAEQALAACRRRYEEHELAAERDARLRGYCGRCLNQRCRCVTRAACWVRRSGKAES